ncbi:hypothetical protein E3P91_00530 [Wallemia ichthyophaga]|nr:hypothetical protein E3P91_00530 [Wallemia ichthyophaga]
MDALVKDAFSQNFIPSAWLPGGHLQTIFATLLDTTQIDSVEYRRHTLSLKDGGSLSLDIHNPGKLNVVVFCHGLTGGSHESYIRSLIAQLSANTTSVVMNFRGCANTSVDSPLFYSGGQTNDLRCAMLYLSNTYPSAQFIGVGFSLGANVLTKFVGEEGDRCPFKAAIALGNPWDLVKSSEQLESTFLGHYLYNRAMGNNLKNILRKHSHAIKNTHPQELAHLDALRWPTVKDFDNTITRKLGGHPPHFPFPSAEAFYAYASSSAFLHNVKIPLLGVNAEDDPIVMPEAWPEPAEECKSSPSNLYKCKANPNVHIYHTKHGGHLAWFGGGHPLSTFRKGPKYTDAYPPPRRWISKPIARIVDELFSDAFPAAPGRHIKPVKSTNSDIEWETDDQEDGQPPPEEDFSQIALTERVKHASWKARLSAYAELIDQFKKSASDDDPVLKPWLSSPDTLSKFVTDSNAAAQDKGIEALTELLKQSGQNAASLSGELCKPTIEKAFNASRPATKVKAIELCLSFVEVDGTADTVIANVIDSLAAKQPKLVATCVTALKELVSQFGFKPITNTKPLLKSLTRIFAHSDKNVRSEGTLLAQSIYTYLGQSLFPLLEELKPVQVKELKESFENLESDGKGAGSGKASRLTRQAQAEAEAAQAGGEEEGVAESNQDDGAMDLGFDPNEDIPPVDVIKTLNPEFYTLIESKKWQERKEVIDQLLETLNKAPKIEASSDYSDLINALARRISELNINVVIGAAQALEKLGRGLPSSTFAGFKNTISKPLFERLKERKATVADALGGALDAIFAATSFSDFMDDITTYAKHKNPQVKQGTLQFLVRALKSTKAPPTQSEQKDIGAVCTATLEDSFEPVRAASAESLGTLMKIVGERAMNPIVESLDGQRKGKVMEFYEKAEVKAKPGFKPKAAAVSAPALKAAPPKQPAAAPPRKPAAAPAKPPTPQSDPINGFDESAQPPKPPSPVKPPTRAPPSRLLNKKPAVASAPAPAAAKAAPASAPAASASKPKSTGGVAPSEQPKLSMSAEDAEAKAAELIPEKLVSQLSDSNWKERLQGIEDLHKWCIDEENHQQLSCEVLFRFLSKKPGWAEKNFQVSAKQFSLLGVLADTSESFNRACASLAVGPLVEKIGDMKLKKPAGDTLIIFSEKTSHQFVLSQGYEAISKIKAPKAQADAMLFVQQLLNEFGIAGLALKDLIEFLKTGLKSANAMVRTNATKTLVTLKLFVGSDIRGFLDDLNPQLLTTIDSEFAKVEGQEPPEPSRSCADAAKPPAGGAPKDGAAAGGDAMDDLFPRQNLDKLIPSGTVASSKSDAWKTRKEALEGLFAVLEVKQNSRLQPNMNADLVGALKGRLGDQNKIVQGLALNIIQKIALAMGKPFEKYVKAFVAGVAGIASDQKANVRASAIATLDAMATACEGVDSLVSSLAIALESSNPTLRSNVLEWLNLFMGEKIPPTGSTDLAPLASPIVSSLEDRNGDVRKNAQALLPHIIASAGYGFVESKTEKLKPAAKNTVLPILQGARGAAKPAPAAAAPSKPAQVEPAPASSRPKVPSAVRPPPASGTPVKAKPTFTAPHAPTAGTPIARPTGLRSRFGALSKSTAAPACDEEESASGMKARIPSKKPSSGSIASTSSAQTPSSDTSYPFNSSDLMSKRQRAVKDGSSRFTLGGEGGVRPEQIDYMEHQTQPFLSARLHSLLFSTDRHAESDYLSGLAVINDAVQEALGDIDKFGLGVDKSRQYILANVDIILKYVTLRLFDNNTSIILRTLEVIELTLRVLDEVNAQLTDYEANAFLPSLIIKSGDNKEPVRVRIRAILKLLGRSYPPSKVFGHLLDHGTTCKNSRARSESIDELGSIINRHGMGVLSSGKALRTIGASLSDRDSAVRNSVLNTLVEVYKIVGEQVWSMVGELQPKEFSMLEERLKRQPERGTSVTGKPAPGSRIAQRPSSAHSRISQPNTLRSESPSRPESRSSAGVSSRTVNRSQSPAVESPRKSIPTSKIGAGTRGIRPPSQLGRTSALPQPSFGLPQPSSSSSSSGQVGKEAPSRPTSLSSNKSAQSIQSSNQPPADPIAGILSNEPERSVDSLKVIQRKLESPSDELVRQADRLVTNITTQMFNTFETLREEMVPNVFRLAKHLIQTLNATVDSPTIAATLSSDSIRLLLEELTTRLLQTAESSSLKDLSRFINMLLLRLFTHGDLTAIFSALFDLLSAATINLHNLKVRNESAEAKLPELVLKCVWKTARNVKDDLEAARLDPSVLLYTLEQFLQKIPPAEWRSRASDEIALGDMPLRTVKTIIQSLVAVYDDKVYEKLDLVSNPEDSIVYTYLYRLLNRGPPSAVEGGMGLGIKNVPQVSSTANNFRDSQISVEDYGVNERLRKIFDKISESTTNKEGITDLYVFQKEHPEKQARIDKQLGDLGDVFNSYIKRVWRRLSMEEEERASVTSPAPPKTTAVSPSPAAPRSRSSMSSAQNERRTSLDEKSLNRISTLFGSKPQSLYAPGEGEAGAGEGEVEMEAETPTVFSQTEGVIRCAALTARPVIGKEPKGRGQEELQDAIKVRESAFVEEYGYSKEELVLYPLDNQALQILATDYSGTPVGSCRFTPLPQDLDNLPPSSTLNPQTENSARELFKDSQGGRFWWLAVSPAGRGRGVAGGLIKYCEEYTAEMLDGYNLATKLWRTIIYIFFREVVSRGIYNIPPQPTPVIFVAGPHHNQFLDGIILCSEVLRASNRKLSFLVASKSMHRFFIGDMARAMESIPVKRAADAAKSGIGSIYMSHSAPTTHIFGIGTQFTRQLSPNMSIALPSSLGGASAEVVDILNDSHLILKKDLSKPQAISALKAINPTTTTQAIKYKVMPHIDQHSMYKAVYDRLEDGGCIGIFPEGGSHDKTDLLPLKAGVSIMALGAMSKNPNLEVKIVPVGMSYFNAHKFRSRAVIEFGTPRTVPRDLVHLFSKGGSDKRLACSSLLNIIYDGLKTVTVRAPDYETLMLIQAGRRLYSPPGYHPPLGEVVELNRRLIAGYLDYKDEPKIQQLKAKVLRYNRRLKDLGIRDHQVDSAARSPLKSATLLFYRIELLMVWGALALPGAVLHLPVFFVAKSISKAKAKEALAASTVKVKARDVIGTWKVLVSLALIPLLYCFYITSATLAARRYGESWQLSSSTITWTPLWTLALLPCLGMSALKFGEVGMDIYKSLPPLFLSLIPGNENEIQKLKSTRASLSKELNDIIEEYGPKQIENFESKRVVAKEQPSLISPEQQSNLSTFQWLDEMLFGWSASKKAGEESQPVSRSDESGGSTPAVGEEGDFDAVVSFLETAKSK